MLSDIRIKKGLIHAMCSNGPLHQVTVVNLSEATEFMARIYNLFYLGNYAIENVVIYYQQVAEE